MRTTLSIDDDVLAEARQIADATGRSLGAVVSELARRALTPATIRDDGGFPVFDVPADAQTFGAVEVGRALDED